MKTAAAVLSTASIASAERAVSVRKAGLAACLLGLALVFATGFAWPSALHNATHDARHAFAFPCH